MRDFDGMQIIVMFHLIGSRDGEESSHLDEMNGKRPGLFQPMVKREELEWKKEDQVAITQRSLACRCPGRYGWPTAGLVD